MKLKYIVFIVLAVFISMTLIFYFKPFGPLNSAVTIDKIVVYKQDRTLVLLSNDSVVKTYAIALGRVPIGHKEFEGDRKTPEGLYYINDKNPNSGYHKNLGVSYPNKKDIEYAKSIGKDPGGLIKIHGMRNGIGWIGRFHLFMDWTMGCIAVTNTEIDELYERVPIGTPIDIKP